MASKGILTDIQRLSTEDGPGIRTVFFFKGCSMHCAWCHNPESIMHVPELGVIREKCIDCGDCIPVCPAEALSLRDGRVYVDRDRCMACFRCVRECFSSVFAECGLEISAEEAEDIAKKDLPYYRASGGGVTLSGGEPLLQIEFMEELIDDLSGRDIDVIVETALNADLSDSSLQALRKCMAVYADVKFPDRESYRIWTGGDADRIAENLRELDEAGIPVLVRTPVIPGVNDDAGTLIAIRKTAESLRNGLGYRLIPYNPLGLPKYNEFGKTPRYGRTSLIDPAVFAELEKKVME